MEIEEENEKYGTEKEYSMEESKQTRNMRNDDDNENIESSEEEETNEWGD